MVLITVLIASIVTNNKHHDHNTRWNNIRHSYLGNESVISKMLTVTASRVFLFLHILISCTFHNVHNFSFMCSFHRNKRPPRDDMEAVLKTNFCSHVVFTYINLTVEYDKDNLYHPHTKIP